MHKRFVAVALFLSTISLHGERICYQLSCSEGAMSHQLLCVNSDGQNFDISIEAVGLRPKKVITFNYNLKKDNSSEGIHDLRYEFLWVSNGIFYDFAIQFHGTIDPITSKASGRVSIGPNSYWYSQN